MSIRKSKDIIICLVISLSLSGCVTNTSTPPPKTPPIPPPSSEPIEEHADLVSEVQALLNKRGYNAGSSDGVAGPMTRDAIRAFEKDNSLPVDGMLDDAVYTALTPSNTNPELLLDVNNTTSASTPAAERLRTESKIFNQSGLQACLITGGASGMLAFIIKRDLRTALGTAIVACGVGVGSNYYLQQRREQYANSEQRLEQMIADVRADNQRLSRIVQSAEEVIVEDSKTINEVDKAYKQKQLTVAQARKQLQAVDDNRVYLEQTLANLKKREAEWVAVAEDEREHQLESTMLSMDNEIDQLKNQIASLETDLEILVNRRSVSPIG